MTASKWQCPKGHLSWPPRHRPPPDPLPPGERPARGADRRRAPTDPPDTSRVTTLTIGQAAALRAIAVFTDTDENHP